MASTSAAVFHGPDLLHRALVDPTGQHPRRACAPRGPAEGTPVFPKAAAGILGCRCTALPGDQAAQRRASGRSINRAELFELRIRPVVGDGN